MKAERYQQIEERSAFLQHACNGDEGLRDEVESLLAYDARAKQFIETPPDDLAAALLVAKQKPSMVGQTLGHDRVVSLLGVGGMGEVYPAEDTRLKRLVALKLLPAEFTTDPGRLRRFEQGAPTALFKTRIVSAGPMLLGIQYDVTADGQRFLIETIVGEATPVSVILNWTAGQQ